MNKKIFTVILLLVLFIQFISAAEEGRKLSNGFKEVVDADVTFQWKIEGNNLHIVLSAPTEGWVAVGFNPSRVMKDADYKLVYVDGSTVNMEDHFGTALFAHKIDTSLDGSSDFQVIEGKEEMGITTVDFTIPLNSGDQYDKVLAEGDEVKVLLAYGVRDNLSQIHKKRGSLTIIL